MMHGQRNPIWIVPLVLALLVAAFGWRGDQRLREVIETDVRAQLQTTLDANATALEIWIANQIRLATSIAADPELLKLALEQLSRAEAMQGDRRLLALDQKTEDLHRILNERLGAAGYNGILVSTNFTVVGASGPARIRFGQTFGSTQVRTRLAALFATGQPAIVTPFRPGLPGRGRPRPALDTLRAKAPGQFQKKAGTPKTGTGAFRLPPPVEPPDDLRPPPEPDRVPGGDVTLMQVAVPIRDADGTTRGALSLIINTETEFSRILSVARSGDSGETYAFDQHGLMISRSRFDSDLALLGLIENKPNATAALNLRLADPGGNLVKGFDPTTPTNERPLIRLVADAVEGKNGLELAPTHDYRGVPVVGAWRWLPSLEFGIATQVDAEEAYAPMRVLRFVFVILFALLVATASSLFVFSYLNTLWRRRVTEAELKARQLGQYTLVEKIGEGGMGVVYRARHALMRRDTAVKLLLPERATREAIERFEREVQLTCRLTHPNTIQVYDYGRTPEGIFYYVMELLRGFTLKDLVGKFGPLPEPRVVYVLAQVCDALHEAHESGLVHRDLKPANIFLANRGGVPDSVKVLDFGLVREFRAVNGDRRNLSGDHIMAGTPAFMAPESIRNPSASDPRSDVYALGALAYHMVTGRNVFEGENEMDVFGKHLSEAPVEPSRRTSNLISPQLEEIILRCLEKDPARRPQSVADLRALLLATPRAAEWTRESREAWWKRHEGEIPAPASPPPGTPPGKLDATVKITFTPKRIGAGRPD